MIASLKPTGVMSIVVPHGVLFRGSREGEIRQALIESDLIEAVIGLPSALFYGPSNSAVILVINRKKPDERAGKVLFINADRNFAKRGEGNVLLDEHVERIVNTFKAYAHEERFSKVVALEAIRTNGFNLSIRRYADSSPLAGLVTQYDQFEKRTIRDLAVEINSAKRGGAFEDKLNALYIPIAGKHPTDSLQQLSGSHEGYYQVVLHEAAINSYVAQFLGTSVGQHALEVMRTGSTIQRLSREDLNECSIALPDYETQERIVVTHRKLASLKDAINTFDQELSLNPTGLAEFQQQLDSMLSVIGELSQADFVRSIIRQGESNIIEFKETFSLDVRKETKEKYIEEASLKTVVAFLNSEGGVLHIVDKFLLHFKNTMRQRIGEAFYPFINNRLVEVDGKRVLVVEVQKGERPCFLDEKIFFVRTNPATDKLEGTKQYEYIKHRFGT
jgi:hypothetical protein